MKINRLLTITTILLNRETVTAKELASRFDVSVRTIYRDIDVLSSAGVPVYTSKGNGGGISLLPDYTLNKAFLSESEGEGLLLALKAMNATRYPEAETILDKMGALFKSKRPDDWLRIDFAGWGSQPNEQNKFNHIQDAILNRRVISFDYVNADGARSSRLAEPETLVCNISTWYLEAYCLKRDERRVFRLSRIKNISVTARHFTKRTSHPETNKKTKNSRKPIAELKLLFSEQALNRLYDDFDESLIRKNDDGSFAVTVSMPLNEWVYGYILSFGPYVRVLAPAPVKRAVQSRLQEAIKNYEKPPQI